MSTVYLCPSCETMYDYYDAAIHCHYSDLPMGYSDDPNFTIKTQEGSEKEIIDELE